jgi:hypothetical protein
MGFGNQVLSEGRNTITAPGIFAPKLAPRPGFAPQTAGPGTLDTDPQGLMGRAADRTYNPIPGPTPHFWEPENLDFRTDLLEAVKGPVPRDPFPPINMHFGGVVPPILPEDRGGILPEDRGGILPEDRGGILPEDRGGILPGDRGGILPGDRGGVVLPILPEDRGGILPGDRGGILPGDGSGVVLPILPEDRGGILPDYLSSMDERFGDISEALSQLLSRKDPYSMVEGLGNRPPVFDPEALVSRINETPPGIVTPQSPTQDPPKELFGGRVLGDIFSPGSDRDLDLDLDIDNEFLGSTGEIRRKAAFDPQESVSGTEGVFGSQLTALQESVNRLLGQPAAPTTDWSVISEALSQLLSRKDPYSMVEDLGNRPPSPVFDPEALVSRINETRPVFDPEALVSRINETRPDIMTPVFDPEALVSRINETRPVFDPEALVSRINETRPVFDPEALVSRINEARPVFDPEALVSRINETRPDIMTPVFDPEALVSRINETRPDIMTPPATDLSVISEALSQLLSRQDPYSMVEDLARSANPYATRTQPNTEPYRSTAPQYSDPDLTRSANPYATPVGLDALMNDYVRNSTRRLSATPSRGF